MIRRVLPLLALLAATGLAAAGPACMAFNQTCTAFVDDPDGIVGWLAEAIPVVKDEVRVEDAAMGQLVAESYLVAFSGSSIPEPDVGVENAGSIRAEGLCEAREELAAGPVRRKTLREVLPFDDTVGVAEITEQGLKDVLEHSYSALASLDPQSGAFLQLAGLEVAVDCSLPAERLSDAGRERGSRVTGMILRPRTDVPCSAAADCLDPAYPECVQELTSLVEPSAGALLCGRSVDTAAPSTERKVRVALNSFLAAGNDDFVDFADPAVTTLLGQSDSLNFQIVAAHFAATYPETSPYPAKPRDRIVLLNCR